MPQTNGNGSTDTGDIGPARPAYEFLADTDLALPPMAIHRNLLLSTEYDRSKNTLHRWLTDLCERGLVKRVDPKALDDSRIVPPPGDGDVRAWYMATDA